MSHLNISSLRNKFESLKLIISPIFDISLVLEAKIDESFPNNQFSINEYRVFRRDKNCFGGGLCLYFKVNITSKQLNLHTETEAIYLEVNIRRGECLIVGLFKPPNQKNTSFLEQISKLHSIYLDSYENITLLGNSNMTPVDKILQHFTDCSIPENLINEPTCFKGNSSCMDFIITNRKSYFKNTFVTITGISDFRKLTAVSLKSQILKAHPRLLL